MEEIQEQGRQSYAALLFGLHRAERTGILELHQNRNWRKLYLVRGTPVLYESSIASERLNKTILQAGLVEQKPLSKLLSKLQPGEQLEDKLVESKLIGPEELHAHKRVLLERGAAAGLAWTSFKWRFLSNDSVGSRIDPALIPDINPLRGLWSAVKQHVTMDEALPFVDDKEAGNIQATEELAAIVEAMELEEPLNQLPDALQEDALSFEDLFSKIHDKSGHLVPLIWLLETVALVTRENRSGLEALAHLCTGQDLAGEEPLLGGSPETKAPPAQPSAAAASGTETKPVPSASERQNRTISHLPELLKTTRRHRAGKDYYAFLDLDRGAAQDDIEVAYHRHTKQWTGALEIADLGSDARGDAEALLAAAEMVFETLSDTNQRTEYDSRLEQGENPRLAALPPEESVEGEQENVGERLAAIRQLVEKGDTALAVAALQQLRVAYPSDPAILNTLGWATWQHRGIEDNEAEEFFKLALTFDAEHVDALENLGRISAEQGDHERLNKLVRKVLKLQPDNPWAVEVAKNAGQAGEKSRKGKKSFWKRGS